MRLIHWVCFCAILCLCACSSQEHVRRDDSATAGLRSPHAKELVEFSQFLKAVHPELFRFVSEEAFDQALQREVEELERASNPTQFDVGRSYHRIIALVGDFHMQVALPLYQPDQRSGLSLLPLHLIPVEGQFLIDASSQPWPVGTRLISIEGEPINELWEQARGLVSADGAQESAKDAILVQNFPKFFHLMKGLSPSYKVTIERPGGTPESVTLSGVDPKEFGPMTLRRHSWRAQRFGPSQAWPTLERPDPSTAVLRMQGFGNPDHKQYIAKLEALLKSVGSVERLVLDLRQNQGGFRTYGVFVINHLVDAPYTQWRGMAAKVLQIPEVWKDRVMFTAAPEKALTRLFPEADKGPALREGDYLANIMKPEDSTLKEVELVVLVNGLTNSAANEFVLSLKKAKPKTKVVGQQVGGGCDRHVGEFPVLYKSPASGIMITVSLISVRHVLLNECKAGEGLVPEYPIRWKRQDLVEGKDPYFSRVAFD